MVSNAVKLVGGLAALGGIGLVGYFAYQAMQKIPCDEALIDTCQMDEDGNCFCCEPVGESVEDMIFKLLNPDAEAYYVPGDEEDCDGGGGNGHDCSWKQCIYNCCGTDIDKCGGGPNYYSGGHGVWNEATQLCECGFATREVNAARCVPVPMDLTMKIDAIDFTGSAKLLQTPGWSNCTLDAPWFSMCALFAGLCPEGPAKYPNGYQGSIVIQVYDQWGNKYKGAPVRVGMSFVGARKIFGFKIPDAAYKNGIKLDCGPYETLTDTNGVASFPIVQTFDAGAGISSDVLVTVSLMDQDVSRTGQISHISIGCGYIAKDVLLIPDALHTCQYWKYGHVGCD